MGRYIFILLFVIFFFKIQILFSQLYLLTSRDRLIKFQKSENVGECENGFINSLPYHCNVRCMLINLKTISFDFGQYRIEREQT